MDSWDERQKRWLNRFEQHKNRYLLLALSAYLLVNGAINASSVLIEDGRDGVRDMHIWEPIIWELTSAISVLILLPMLFWFFRRYPLQFANIKLQILRHVFASIVFSLAHVVMMVAMREGVYWLMDGNYDFSPWLRELWYEYRKDAWGYVSWLVVYHLASALYARIKGEASLIKDSEDNAEALEPQVNGKSSQAPEHFLVRKLDKEFLLKVADVEWLESSGNYVNLYLHGRIYPLRGTLTQTLQRIEAKGFSRIHRSYAVNHQAIDNIQYAASGDGTVTLKSGHQLPISRRYKVEFKNSLL